MPIWQRGAETNSLLGQQLGGSGLPGVLIYSTSKAHSPNKEYNIPLQTVTYTNPTNHTEKCTPAGPLPECTFQNLPAPVGHRFPFFQCGLQAPQLVSFTRLPLPGSFQSL